MRARLGVVSACAALASVLAAAPAHAGSWAPPGAAGPRALVSRPRDGRAGPLLRKLESPKAKAAEDLAPDAFLYCGDSLRKPASMALRGGGAEKLSIVFISAEVAPWSVTGGLGAVRAPLLPPNARLHPTSVNYASACRRVPPVLGESFLREPTRKEQCALPANTLRRGRRCATGCRGHWLQLDTASCRSPPDMTSTTTHGTRSSRARCRWARPPQLCDSSTRSRKAWTACLLTTRSSLSACGV
jgi:hypothetical protein